MSDALRELRRILDRPDRKLTRYMRILNEDFKPNADGSITFTSRTFEVNAKVRKRYRAARRRIAAVDGGGKARSALLAALDEIDQGMGDFATAARIGYSVEQVTALQAATRRVDHGTRQLRKVRTGLAE